MKTKKMFARIVRWLLSPNGLFITIALGILINFASTALNNLIERQRYLELLQLEITQNLLIAGNRIKNEREQGKILTYQPYSDAVYKAGLQSGYILTIDTDDLNKITSFYVVYLPTIAALEDSQYRIQDDYLVEWEKCIYDLTETSVPSDFAKCDKSKLLFDSVLKNNSANLSKSSENTSKVLNEILTHFRPVQTRRKSYLLRLLMGDKSLEILK